MDEELELPDVSKRLLGIISESSPSVSEPWRKELDKESLDRIEKLYQDTLSAQSLLEKYERATDEDMKHEVGFQFSELIADIEDEIDILAEQGINTYTQ